MHDAIPVIGREIDDYALGRPIILPEQPAVVPTKQACVVTSVRNEGTGLLEWIAHYRVLGFDTIVIYSNDNTDGSDLLLETLAQHGIIHLRWNDTGPDRSPQMKAYRHAFWVDETVKQHHWLVFLDADEFLIPVSPSGEIAPIAEYCLYITDNFAASAIELNWKWFGGSHEYARRRGGCMERFSHSFANPHVKTLFKRADAKELKNFHHPIFLPEAKVINGAGEPLAAGIAQTGPVYDLGQVNHYWQKSFEEYHIKKTRGRGAFGPAGEQRSYAAFFDWWEAGAVDRRPGDSHLEKVAEEMIRLGQLSGISAALQQVETRVAELLTAAPDLRNTYDELLAKYAGPRSHVHDAQS